MYMKKLLSYILVFTFVFSLIPLSLLNASAATYDILFPVNNGGKIAYVYGYSAAYGDVHHDGIDIHAYGDDTIYAVADGTVGATSDTCFHVSCGYACEHYNTFGNYIRIDHADGTKSYYGHLLLNSLRVKTGDKVVKGQPIATMGSSGYSTGKHLHFELRVGSTKINVNHAADGGSINYATTGYIKPVLEDIAEGLYYIKNNSNGKYLSVDGGTDANSQNVSTADFALTEAFGMNLTKADSGYKICPECCETRLINSYGTTVQSGNNVNIWNDEEDSSEWWGFEKVDGGYVIRNIMNPNCVLDVESDGNVIVSAYTGAATQVWTLETEPPVTEPPVQNNVKLGDVNADGTVDSVDYLLVKRYCFNTYEMTSEEFARADVDATEAVDSIDYLLIKRICFGTYGE